MSSSFPLSREEALNDTREDATGVAAEPNSRRALLRRREPGR
jgi:hypothetical protein